jgi:hypothetical protein
VCESYLCDAASELESRRFDQWHWWDQNTHLDSDKVNIVAEVVALPEGGDAAESDR